MKAQTSRHIQIMLSILLLLLASTPVWAQETTTTPQWSPTPNWLIYIIIISIILVPLFTILFLIRALSGSVWTMADALSEEVDITLTKKENGVEIPQYDSSGKPIMVTELRASSSRLVALMGMIVILMMFIGFGVFALFSFAKIGEVPNSTNDALKYLTGGLTLFAPYVVNKFSSMFESFAPKKG